MEDGGRARASNVREVPSHALPEVRVAGGRDGAESVEKISRRPALQAGSIIGATLGRSLAGVRRLARSIHTAGRTVLSFGAMGHFDGVIGRAAHGWVIGPTRSDKPIVEILVDGRVVACGVAEAFRPDLCELYGSDGYCGFQIQLPSHLFEGGKERVHARVRGALCTLAGSPREVNFRQLNLTEAFSSSGNRDEISARSLAGILARLEERIDYQNRLMNLALKALADGDCFPHATIRELDGRAVGFGDDGLRRGEFYEECQRFRSERGDVVFFSIIDWQFRKQRPQHLCGELARAGYRVLYVSVHLEQAKVGTAPYAIVANPGHGIFEVKLRVSGRVPSVYSGFDDPAHVRELCLALEELRRDLSIGHSVSILNFPTWYPVASSLPGTFLIYDCLDHVSGFSNVSHAAVAVEKDLIAGADAVVTSSGGLFEWVRGTRPNVALVRNACEFKRFSSSPPGAVASSKRPIIGYYGAISEWFDAELIASTAIKHSDWEFVLIGSTEGANLDPVRGLDNVELLGEMPYEDLPNYLHQFDVCTIPFKVTELIKATNPVKLYEYLAAGKPVVCTDFPEARIVPPGLVHIARDVTEFEDGIMAALLERDEELVVRRREFASENSWEARGSAYLELLSASQPKVSIVVLCYNNVEFTKACLHSVDKYSDYPNLEIVCVDNASTDGTKDFLLDWARERTNCSIVLNSENLGFAGGNNEGIRAATGEYIILLNNDTYVTAGWVWDLIRPMQRDADIGLTGPVTNMIGGVQKIRIDYADMSEMAQRSRRFTMRRKTELYEADVLAFFCVAIRRSVIDDVGMLDPEFGVGFFEDDDYCERARRAGYRLICVDGVFVHHHLSASFDALGSERKRELFERNKAIFENKWGEWKPHSYRADPEFGA